MAIAPSTIALLQNVLRICVQDLIPYNLSKLLTKFYCVTNIFSRFLRMLLVITMLCKALRTSRVPVSTLFTYYFSLTIIEDIIKEAR